MHTPLEITFRGMSSSLWIEAFIETWVARLERSCGVLQRCAVVIDRPHGNHRHGNEFQVRVEVAASNCQVVASRVDPDNENMYAAITDAFRAARRQLHDAHV